MCILVYVLQVECAGSGLGRGGATGGGVGDINREEQADDTRL